MTFIASRVVSQNEKEQLMEQFKTLDKNGIFKKKIILKLILLIFFR